LLRETTVRLAKMVKKGRAFENFPVLFPVFRESGPHGFSTKPRGEERRRARHPNSQSDLGPRRVGTMLPVATHRYAIPLLESENKIPGRLRRGE
jgi:hypothetical protein